MAGSEGRLRSVATPDGAAPDAPSATLVVRGGRPLRGSIRVPGDKSISHRALILGALADGPEPTCIAGLSACADVRATRRALEHLGAHIEGEPDGEVRIHGRGPQGLAGPPVRLDCQDSGTTMRLLAGLLAGQRRRFRLEAAPSLQRRPMNRVVEPLGRMGAELRALGEAGRPPLEGEGRALRGADLRLPRASAQVGSALLLAALNAQGETRVHYPAPVRDHTERLLAAMAAPIAWDARSSTLVGPVRHLARPGGGAITVPGDLSSAAFLLCAAAILPGSRIRLPGVGINPGRTGILDILRAMGAPVAVSGWRQSAGEPLADLATAAAELAAIGLGQPLVPRAIDELPLLAVLGARARGRTVLIEAGELRLKESDRIEAICSGLRRMGADIVATEAGFIVEGPGELRGAELDGRGDHRIVMALAVAGLAATGETRIRGAERIGDSYPGFVEDLVGLGAQVHLEPSD